MADANYDAIIIGGGHNGLTLACYLAKAGMTVVVLERQHELGGATCSEELPLPGWMSNPCANFVYYYRYPPYHDFNLWEKGAQVVFSELSGGMVFDDRTCLQSYPAYVGYDPRTDSGEEYVPESVEKTLREIARFSERDAETVSILIDKCHRKWMAACVQWSTSPPTPWGEKDAIEQLFDDPVDGMDPRWQVMTVKEIAWDLFESSQLRTYFMRAAMAGSACYPGDVMHPADMVDRLRHIGGMGRVGTFVNGIHTLAHALMRAFVEMGGKFFIHHEVDKVLIENGTAKGVRLTDGTEIEAKKLMVSAVDVTQTMFRFVGEQYFSPELAQKIRNFSYDRGQVFWGQIAFHEPPKWRAADWNPDVLRSSKLYWGPNDAEYLADRYQLDVFTHGIPEKLIVSMGIESMFDKTRNPAEMHNALFEVFTAPTRYFTEREWLRMKARFPEVLIEQWQWYAPNMTKENIIGVYTNTPYDVEQRNINMREGGWCVGAMYASQMGRFRPTPELAHYRTPIKNLYLCGASSHYGGWVTGRVACACYHILAEDYGLPRVWEEKAAFKLF